MHPLLELKLLLRKRDGAVTGEVVSVNGSTIQVRLPGGVADLRSIDATTYNVGDAVLTKNGIVLGKVKPLASVPVYNV